MNKKKLFLGVIGAGFDSDYRAILTRATALGYTLPSAPQQIKQNTFLVALKAAGVWALLDVLYVYATNGSSDFATLNWKAPTLFQNTKVNTPAFTANQGFKGNGSTSYLNTNFNPLANSVQATQNANSWALGINSNEASSDLDEGFVDNGPSFIEFVSRAAFFPGESIARINNGAASFIRAVNATRIGNYIGRRTSATDISICKGGIQYGVAAGVASVAFPNLNIYLCGRNASGVLTAPGLSLLTHFAWGNFGGSVVGFNNAWNNYFTSL